MALAARAANGGRYFRMVSGPDIRALKQRWTKQRAVDPGWGAVRRGFWSCIPARYCTGYLGDIGVSVDVIPMDFSAWVVVFLDGRW